MGAWAHGRMGAWAHGHVWHAPAIIRAVILLRNRDSFYCQKRITFDDIVSFHHHYRKIITIVYII